MHTLRTFSIADLADAKYIALKGTTLDRYGNPYFTTDFIVWAMQVILFFQRLHAAARSFCTAFQIGYGHAIGMVYKHIRQGKLMTDIMDIAARTLLTKDQIIWKVSSTWETVKEIAVSSGIMRPKRYAQDNPYDMAAYKKGNSTMRVKTGKDTHKRSQMVSTPSRIVERKTTGNKYARENREMVANNQAWAV